MSPLILDYAGNKRQRGMNGKLRPFALSPAKINDVRRLVDIEFHAFENEQVNQVLSYRDYKKPAHFERSVALYQAALNKDDFSGHGMHGETIYHSDNDSASFSSSSSSHSLSRVEFKRITDIESGDVVSFAKLEFKAYTIDEMHTPLDIGHEGEPQMNRDWFGLNERLRREYIGLAPHCCK